MQVCRVYHQRQANHIYTGRHNQQQQRACVWLIIWWWPEKMANPISPFLIARNTCPTSEEEWFGRFWTVNCCEVRWGWWTGGVSSRCQKCVWCLWLSSVQQQDALGPFLGKTFTPAHVDQDTTLPRHVLQGQPRHGPILAGGTRPKQKALPLRPLLRFSIFWYTLGASVLQLKHCVFCIAWHELFEESDLYWFTNHTLKGNNHNLFFFFFANTVYMLFLSYREISAMHKVAL